MSKPRSPKPRVGPKGHFQRGIFIITDRDTPTCGRADCDIAENPSHWINIRLSRKARRALNQFEDMAKSLDELVSMFDAQTGPQKLARLSGVAHVCLAKKILHMKE